MPTTAHSSQANHSGFLRFGDGLLHFEHRHAVTLVDGRDLKSHTVLTFLARALAAQANVALHCHLPSHSRRGMFGLCVKSTPHQLHIIGFPCALPRILPVQTRPRDMHG